MNKREFMDYVRDNNIELKKNNIVIGEKSNSPYVIGCYREGDTWFLYEVGERQNISIIKQGAEEDIFKYMWFKMRRRIK